MDNNRKLWYKIIQLVGVVVLGLVLFNIFLLVDIIQGTGRVINYAGIIRGGTQRLVKLETNGIPRDDLILYLDGILTGLQTGDSDYQLDKLNDVPYQEKLADLDAHWVELQAELLRFRVDPSNRDTVIVKSEAYFDKANDVVGTAEFYQARQTQVLTVLELVMVILLGLLIVIAFQQTLNEVQLLKKNKELAAAAYFDKPTGLPGRLSCEEQIWTPMDRRQGPYCMVMFDLNNLKWVNDTAGHRAGDALIKDFADILNHLSNENVFIGRYGGDEFIMIIKNHREDQVKQLLQEVALQTERYNQRAQLIKIQYAVGYQYGGDSLPQMLEKADEKMYANKSLAKADNKDG